MWLLILPQKYVDDKEDEDEDENDKSKPHYVKVCVRVEKIRGSHFDLS